MIMRDKEFNSEFCNVKYISEDNVVLLTWKKFCCYENYRKSTTFALELLKKYPGSNFIVDARNGFEDDKEDVEWGFSVLLPAMAKTDCACVVFIMNEVNEIEEEMDMWTQEFMKYFTVKKVGSYEEAVKFLICRGTALTIELGKETDIDELEQLYNDLNDHLKRGINYPGWKKGVYPIRESAIHGIKNYNLYVAKYKGKIIGSIILSHEPEEAYYNVEWQVAVDYSEVFVIHTFVVHPDYLKYGVGKALMNFADEQGIKSRAKAIRLDVYEKNIPAVRLYEKCGYKYIATVDLGLGNYGLDWFKLYEKLL